MDGWLQSDDCTIFVGYLQYMEGFFRAELLRGPQY